VLAFAKLTEGAALLEVGAGTGKATAKVAPRASAAGWSLTCLEPDPAMAAVLREKLSDLPVGSFQLVLEPFEEFARSRANSFDLLYAAQSWHWVPAEKRLGAASSVLRDGGSLALMWNVARPPERPVVEALDGAYAAALGDEVVAWRERLGPLYCLPAGGRADPGVRRFVAEIEASYFFGPVSVALSPWSAVYESDHWLSLISTQSDHRMLQPEQLRAVQEEVGQVLDDLGGSLSVSYDSTAVLARKLPPRGALE
jgi:SAM-dependent methyltransferase